MTQRQDADRRPAEHRHTGRWLVALGRRPVREAVAALRLLGVRDPATSSDWSGPAPAGDEPLLLERLGVAVLPSRADGAGEAARAGVRRERERWVRAAPPGSAAGAGGLPLSWGLAALGPAGTAAGAGPGRHGVRVAVLDTGVDAAHPDLAGRLAAAVSLLPGEGPEDLVGHGTHCAGLVCGDPSYAVAPGATLLSAKVLDRSEAGREADVLAGVEWAVDQGCRVVSLSLSSPGGGAPSRVFEQVAADLLDEGVVLVAAAGNDSARSQGRVEPVGRPASCRSVVGVGAVGPDLEVADFSNGGARLDLVAPGVDVVSAWPGGGHRAQTGTSVAVPHVAGALALLAAADPAAGGPELVRRLLAGARRVAGPRSAVGAGLVQR